MAAIVLSAFGRNHEVITRWPSTCEICDKVGTITLQPFSSDIAPRLERLRQRIAECANGCGRRPEDVQLIAVSKTRPAEAIRDAAGLGLRDFGENYLQEAEAKLDALAGLPVTWHFIGALQSNKTRTVAARFDWVHTVSRRRIAERLAKQCPPGKVLNVTLQVNVDQDPAKAGVDPADAGELLSAVLGLPNLRVRGLMTILQQNADPEQGYLRLAALFRELAPSVPGVWDTLSMGMSDDFPQAIAAGATHVRIGSALFGPRANP